MVVRGRMLNWIWLFLFVVGAVVAGFGMRMPSALDGAFAGARQSVDLAIGLMGVMSLWLGLMRLAELSGLVQGLARWLRPLLSRLFPDVPEGHPAMGSMVLNLAANVFGLSNAATPLGLRAMRDLETLNRHPGVATDAMCTFLALNTGSVQLIPVTAIAILAASGARNPTAIVGTTLIATACSSIAALVVLKLLGRWAVFQLPAGTSLEVHARGAGEAAERTDEAFVPLPEPGPMQGWARASLWVLAACFGWFAYRLQTTPGASGLEMGGAHPGIRAVQVAALLAVPFALAMLPLYAAGRGVRVYEEFITGARDGFQTGVRIIPYLAAMLVAIGFFRGAGAIDLLSGFLTTPFGWIGFPPELLPMSLLRPLTSSGTLGLFGDLVKTHGPDSFLARAGGTLFGSTETTFYVIAVYFGAVGVRRARHAVWAGLAADAVGALAAVHVVRWFMSAG